MTNWEQWLKQSGSRTDIICAVTRHRKIACTKCILYRVCSGSKDAERLCDEFLDAEALPTRDAVIVNLDSMLNEASQNGWDGYVKTLSRAIELLKEVDE